MNSPELWMACASLIVSLAVLIFGAVQYRAVARKDYVEELWNRVGDCERKHREAQVAHDECERERTRLNSVVIGLTLDMREMAARRIAEEKPPHE